MSNYTNQQKLWISQAYADIQEDPKSYDIGDIEIEQEKVVMLLKEDFEAAFGTTISPASIMEILCLTKK